MPIIKCPECGHQVSSLAATCPSCGVAIAGHIVQCPQCGQTMLASQKTCTNCHAALSPVASPLNRPNEASDDESPRRSWSLGVLAVSFVIALAIILAGWYFYQRAQQGNEQAAYENAMESQEPAVLQNYLDMYPNAPQERRDSITAHLTLLKQIDQDWYNALASQSPHLIERYIQLHPGSVHTTEARLKIDSLDWVAAVHLNTLEGYKQYITKHADGEYIDDAQTNYEKCLKMQVSVTELETISDLLRTYMTNSANRELLSSGSVNLSNADITFADDLEVKKVENEVTGNTDYQVAVTMQVVKHNESISQTCRLTARVVGGRLVDVHIQ